MASRYDVAPKTILPAGQAVASLSNAELLKVSITDPNFGKYAPELRARGLMGQWEASNKSKDFTLGSILKDAAVFYGTALGGALLAGAGGTAAAATQATVATTGTGATMAGFTLPAVTLPSAAALGIPTLQQMIDKQGAKIQSEINKAPALMVKPSSLAIAKEIAAAGSVDELYQLVLKRGATPAEIAKWNAKFGATITADEVEQFKIAAQAELAAQTSSTPNTAAKWVIGSITAGLLLLWLANRKKAA